MKRSPSQRCASAIQIVRPAESIAETHPQLQPALLRLSPMVSQYFTRVILPLFFSTQHSHSDTSGRNEAGRNVCDWRAASLGSRHSTVRDALSSVLCTAAVIVKV